MIRFVAHAWYAGEGFAWSPYHFGGFPMIADPQSAIWTVTLWIPSLISAAPSMKLVDTIHLMHLLVGAFAVFWFGRTQGWRWEASIAAALTYMMAGAATFRLEHMLMTVSYMWVAIALWRLNAAIIFGGLWRGILFGIALAALIIDRNHVAYLGAWFLLAWWVVAALPQVSVDGFEKILKQHYPIAVGGILALMLVAVPVILLLQLADNSNRPEFSYLDSSWQSLHPLSIFTFFLPEYYGALDGSVRHWGPASHIWGGENLTMHRGMLHMYSGVLPLVLIVWLGIIKMQLVVAGVRFFAVASVCYLVYSLGRYTPIFNFLYEFVPGVDLFRRPSDGLFLFGFSIALLTGALFNQLGSVSKFKISLTGSLVIAVTAILILYLMFTTARDYERLEDFAHSLLLPVFATIIIMTCLYLTNRCLLVGNMAMVAILGVAATDLVYHSTNNRMNARSSTHYQVLETTDGHSIFEKVGQLARNEDKFGVSWRTETIGLGPVVQNLPQVIRSQSMLGYNPLRLAGFEKYIAPDMQNSAAKNRNFGMAMASYDSELTNELGLRFIVSGVPIEMLDMGVSPNRFELIDRIQHGRREAYIYENALALDRAKLLKNSGEIRVERYSNTEIQLEVYSERADLLILREFYYPGWIATIDGASAKLLRHDKLFRAVNIPQGKSSIIIRFEPIAADNLWSAVTELLQRENS